METDWDLLLVEGFTTALKDAARVHGRGWPEDDGDLNAAEAVRQAMRLAAVGMVCFLESDPDHPELVKQQTLTRQTQLPSADAVYHFARLHGRNAYRIRGKRGSAHVFQISVWSGSCSNLRDYRCVARQDGDICAALAPGAEVDLVLSAREQPGHWLPLPDGECEIYIRQYYADWDREEPARLTIERVGAKLPPPPPTRAQIAERMAMVGDWLRTQTTYFEKSIRFHLSADPGVLPVLPIPEAFQDNVYLNGHYRCRPEQAVILEVAPPAAVYWGFQLANLQWESMDPHVRQSSLNLRQARLDADGLLRIVISQRDPGVPNWLDTSGRTLGLLSGRYYKAERVPIPTLKTVPFASLGDHLPDGTPRIAPVERQARLHARRASAFRRLCGDQ
ncbi:MAG TPA: DUF1214 domain-containing protein [Nevskiaceae bacterium]|nr:DUF1214 domain-containing protein [Nevskiaceae bacterium]